MDEALEAPHALEAVHDEQGLALRVRDQVTAGADQRTQDRHHLRRADILYHDELADVLRPGTRVVRGNGWDRLRPYRVFRHDAHKVAVVEGGEAVRVEHVEQLSVTELGGRLALDRDVGADARIEHEGLADPVRHGRYQALDRHARGVETPAEDSFWARGARRFSLAGSLVAGPGPCSTRDSKNFARRAPPAAPGHNRPAGCAAT